MDDVKELLKTTLGELERVLSSRTVVGEPIEIQGQTLIPLSSVGFGFGAGGGTGKAPKTEAAEGTGAGTGGGGGIKPVAVIVVSQEGVRIEPIKGGTASVFEKIGESIGKAMEKKSESAKEG
jgi:uncharacterized spore protein YtfJ